MSTLFVIDIDGTIADASRRFAEAGPEPSREDQGIYTRWVRTVQNERSLEEDPPIRGMPELVTSLVIDDREVIFLTSREECWREVTEGWLDNQGLYALDLIMRPDGNWDDTGTFKEKMIKLAMAGYNCTQCVVIDDDPRGDVKQVCLKNGWTFLKAGG